MAAVGVGVDYARLSLVSAELQRGADAGALAGARALDASGGNLAVVKSDALMYFWANYRKSVANATIAGDEPTVVILDPNKDTVKLVASATVPLAFGGFVGMRSKQVAVEGKAQRAVRGLEVVLVLDNTTSMDFKDGGNTTRMANLKSAGRELINILYGDNETKGVETCSGSSVRSGSASACATDYLLTVGVVPFITTVNISPARSTGSNPVVSETDVKALAWGPNNSWKGCVLVREGDLELERAEEPPGTFPVKPYFWRDTGKNNGNDWSSTTVEPWPTAGAPSGQSTVNKTSVGSGTTGDAGPNRGCGEPIMPLQPSKVAALAAIEGMNTKSGGTGTAVPIGLSWGWRLLSPSWKPVWAGESTRMFPHNASGVRQDITVTTPANVPRDYGTRNFEKAVVLFTDGENNLGSQMTAWGEKADWPKTLGTSQESKAEAEINRRTVLLCNEMKKKGIKIYVVLLVPGASTNLLNMYNENGCASGKNTFYHATKGEDLKSIFSAVGSQLANLRLVQ